MDHTNSAAAPRGACLHHQRFSTSAPYSPIPTPIATLCGDLQARDHTHRHRRRPVDRRRTGERYPTDERLGVQRRLDPRGPRADRPDVRLPRPVLECAGEGREPAVHSVELEKVVPGNMLTALAMMAGASDPTRRDETVTPTPSHEQHDAGRNQSHTRGEREHDLVDPVQPALTLAHDLRLNDPSRSQAPSS